MRWLSNLSFSATSSSSSSLRPKSFEDLPSCNDRDRQYAHNRNSGNGGVRITEPRLTRQRKLRHLTDKEVNADPKAEMVGLSQSPSYYSSAPRSPSMPVPLPLPLPLPEGDGDSRFPSPKEVGYGRGLEERERDRDRTGGAGDRGLPVSPVRSVSANGDVRRIVEHLDIRSPRGIRQDLVSAENSSDNAGISISARSAHASPFPSPTPSPQRKSAGDLFLHYNMVPRGNQVWSATDMGSADSPGLPPPAFFDYIALSIDGSPIQSPISRSPHRRTRSPSGSSSPLYSKLTLDLSNTRRESAIVHPLPLPPGAASPSPSAPISQASNKVESLPMSSQWQKGKPIGRGTFGSVYVASNRETGALCAMKEVELLPDDPKSAECIKQLEQEIKVLSNLKHPNIVQYYGSEIVDDHFYICLEYVHPGSINKYLREHGGAMTESVVRNFTRHILSGLAYLHKTKTIHRDIKGANLLVDASGVVKLADFGMAKHLTGQRADLSLKGSPYWMAPELMQAVIQKDNNSDLAFAVDIWSLGCTIIEMLTGKPPWSEYEGAAAMFKVMKDTPAIPESLSPEGKEFLRCCFRRNPAERSTASMLLEHRFLKNTPQPDVPSSSQLYNGMKPMEKPSSPGEKFQYRPDQLPAKGRRKVSSESFMPYSCSPVRMTNDVIPRLPT